MVRSHPWRRKVGRIVALASVLVAGCELGSWFILRQVGVLPEQPYRWMYESTGCLKTNPYNNGPRARSPDELTTMLNNVPHPFFGFVGNPGFAEADAEDDRISPNYENRLRYRILLGDDPRPRSTVTIGIFGASVAGSFADYVAQDPTFSQRLKQGVPEWRDKDVVIRNMAVGGSRQPAQFAIATMYQGLFDVSINLDGYSEVAIMQYPEFPIEFPMYSDVFYSGNGSLAYLRIRLGESICRQISVLPTAIPLLSYSHTYYLLWYNLSQRLNAAFYAAPKPDSARDLGLSQEELKELYARYYQRFSRFQHQVLSANGIRSYFFLQPNQYVPQSKPTFSEFEQTHALNDGEGPAIGERYAHLRRMVGELRASGVPAFDLTMIYSDTSDTVYIDSCCHVNELGNRLMAQSIADIIVREELAARD